MKKIYIIILVLIGLLGVYSIFTYSKNDSKNPSLPVVASSTPAVIPKITPVATIYTGDWKTCRNEKYGYEFKYPPHWIASEPKSGASPWDEVKECSGLKNIALTSTTTYTSTDYINGSLCVPQVYVSFIPPEEVDVWYSDTKIVDDNHIINISKYPANSIIKEYYVDEKKFFVFEVSKDYPCQNGFYPMKVAHNNGILLFDSHDVSDTILQAMLTTFKFLD